MVVRVVKASNLSGGSAAAYVVVELDEPGQRWGNRYYPYLATSAFFWLKRAVWSAKILTITIGGHYLPVVL